MNIKLKFLFKIVCYASAVVIFFYLEGKYNFIFRNSEGKSGMTSLRIASSEFEVFGIVQGELLR